MFRHAAARFCQWLEVSRDAPRDCLACYSVSGPFFVSPVWAHLFDNHPAALDVCRSISLNRCSGLYVWTRDGERKAVRGIPAGCLLVQAGKQLEHATAGHVLAGFHEVRFDCVARRLDGY